MMSPGPLFRSRLWLGVLALLVAAALVALWIVLTAAPALAWGLVLGAGLGALGLAVLARRPAPTSVEGIRLELSRLRIDRLHDHTARAIGYYHQLQALADTHPQPPLRQLLQERLPEFGATLRAIYDLCLALQAFELGESRPPALAGVPPTAANALTNSAEEIIQSTLQTVSSLYLALRAAWHTPIDDAATLTELLDDLAQATSHLQECTATFVPTLKRYPPTPAGHRSL